MEVHTVQPGHTASDVYLLLPEDRICLMGDLGFFQSQPFMAFCDPEAWMTWLEQAEGFAADLFCRVTVRWAAGPTCSASDSTSPRWRP